MAAGAPVVVVQPGVTYGPGDRSEIGGVLHQGAAGTLVSLTFGDLGITMAHVDDIAGGILLAHDRGETGQAYVLGGEITTMAEAVRRVAAIAGHRPPRLQTPTWLLRGLSPLGRFLGPALGTRPNLAELVSASSGVSYWATDARARRELGYAPRDLETGLVDTFGSRR